MIADNTPDLFILDEPTNNLDIEVLKSSQLRYVTIKVPYLLSHTTGIF